MAEERTRRGDLYSILGVNKDCSGEELRLAYKRLAMRWHPDKCSSSGNSICMEQAKHKFQKIQGAYSVLSDSNKRLLYDVGAYDSDDEDTNTGLTEILDEVFEMMNHTKSSENGAESLDELQKLFEDIFSSDGNSNSASGASNKVDKRSFNGWNGSTSVSRTRSECDPGPDLAKPDRWAPGPSHFFSGVS